jgi:hypothetical protein
MTTCTTTSDTLAAWLAGDLMADAASACEQHVASCPQCQAHCDELAAVDQALAAVQLEAVPPAALLATRRALAATIDAEQRAPEVMTLDDVAEFLQLPAEELEGVVHELPAFELAGRLRVRRQCLLEWIRERERRFQDDAAAQWAAATMTELKQEGRAS